MKKIVRLLLTVAVMLPILALCAYADAAAPNPVTKLIPDNYTVLFIVLICLAAAASALAVTVILIRRKKKARGLAPAQTGETAHPDDPGYNNFQ